MDKYFPIAVLHNVSSANRCVEFTNIALGLGYQTVIITNPQGSAAQRGIPLAQKEAFKDKKRFMTLEGIEDVKELFKPEEIVVVAPPPYGKENLSGDIAKEIMKKKFAVIIGGNDPGLSRKDLESGRSVQLDAGRIGSIGTAALALAILSGRFM